MQATPQTSSTPPDASATQEAVRLHLARAAASPETWRARAASAGGFLSAATVVSLWGFSQQVDKLAPTAQFAAVLATALYASSVLAFLVAVVFPSPKAPTTTADFTESVLEYSRQESRPIKRWVWVGAAAAGLGVTCTATTAAIMMSGPPAKHGWVTIRDAQTQKVVSGLCPMLGKAFHATFVESNTGSIEIHLPIAACHDRTRTLQILSSDVVIIESPH